MDIIRGGKFQFYGEIGEVDFGVVNELLYEEGGDKGVVDDYSELWVQGY